VQSLYPTEPGELSDDDLVELYAYPAEWAWLRANFVATLDGAAQGEDHRSGSISTGSDQKVFALLRTLCDLIIVGAGTTRAEGYQPVRSNEVDGALRSQLGLTPVPALAVVSQSLRIDPVLLAGEEAPTIVVTTQAAYDVHANELTGIPVIVASTDEDPHRVDLGRAVEGLVAAGYQRLLCEGGPTLMRDLVASGRLDELCLTMSSQLVGGDPLRILDGAALDRPVRMQLRHLLAADGDLLCRYTTIRR
jgi:riboflavin biosynthesis pyrimidine reductase